jgi:predicted dehydrogenase
VEKTLLKGAVIGVGYLGRFHAQKIKASTQAQLIGVYDGLREQSHKVAAELQVKSFSNLEDVAQEVDFVTVAASTQAHYEVAEFFLKKSIPVLVEKPIAATAELGFKLVDLANKNSTVFSVGHIERFNPAYEYLKLNNKEILFLELNRLAPFRARGSDVSVLHDLMIHDIDLVQFIFNQPIAEYKMFTHQIIRPTVDDVSVRLFFDSGLQIQIQNSRIHPQISRNYRAVLKDHTVFMNTATLEGEWLFPDSSLPDLHRIEKRTVGKVDALALEIEHFISAVKKEKPVAITGFEAATALRHIETFLGL